MRKVFYQCQCCTNCCKWPGFVKLTESDISSIAAFLGMTESGFIQSHTRLRQHRDGLALIDKPNGECIFLDGRDCRVQPVKPAQCGGFPNTWNFPGWRDVCEAVEISQKPGAQTPELYAAPLGRQPEPPQRGGLQRTAFDATAPMRASGLTGDSQNLDVNALS